jgi:hypothetical protein
MPQRRLERHGDGGGLDIDDLHSVAVSTHFERAGEAIRLPLRVLLLSHPASVSSSLAKLLPCRCRSTILVVSIALDPVPNERAWQAPIGRRGAMAGRSGRDVVPIYAFTGSLTRAMPQYGAANGEGITRLSFDDQTGRLGEVDRIGGVDDTAWLVTDAARGRLYSTCEITGTRESAIAAYAVEAGGLRLINRQPTLGNEACHMPASRP